MDYTNLCFGCIEDKGTSQTCPHCGYEEGTVPESLLHLPAGTVLQDKYLLGRVLGQGGFGITYIAWDKILKIKLAIKEYLPQQLVTRAGGSNNVTVYKASISEDFKYGLTRFLEEAQTLACFNENPKIVTVRDYFEANNTAYLVMSYHEGVTLQNYLKSKGGKISVEQALSIFMPVLDALKEVHAAGILHRDISPDNLLIDKNGRVILIDFGAARQAMGEKSKSLSVIMKAGYSPPEQYQSRGKQGPWTDIYAVAASFYRTITGQAPLEAIDRMAEDDLVLPSKLGAIIEPGVEKILLKALAVKVEDRYQCVVDFQAALFHETNQSTKSQSKSAVDSSTGDQDQHFTNEPKRGEDIEKEILLSRLEADLGAERSIIMDLDSVCIECNGTGLKNGNVCSHCKGKGKHQNHKTLSVKIPAKVKEGTRIRLQGQGKIGSNGGAHGDLFLVVKLQEITYERFSHNQYNQQSAWEKAKGKGKTPRRKKRSFALGFHQYMYEHLGSRNQLLNYITVAALCVFLFVGIIGQFDGAIDLHNEGDSMDAAVTEESTREIAQTYTPAVIAALNADYFMDYENGTIPIGDLPIGARVVDPSWEWEFRTGNNYSGSGIVKPVTWILVAKDHYAGLASHVTLLSEDLIGLHAFDNSTGRGYVYDEYGYNHWGDSGTANATHGLRPWLNSSGIHANEGFYRVISVYFKEAVLATTLPNKEWKNGNSYSSQDYVFIPSTTELGDIAHNYTYRIGAGYPYFDGVSNAKRISRIGDEIWRYWTRSPASGAGFHLNIVTDTGVFYNSYSGAYDDEFNAVRPALNLNSEILVSEIRK
jgi:serine/threonine protein kinase